MGVVAWRRGSTTSHKPRSFHSAQLSLCARVGPPPRTGEGEAARTEKEQVSVDGAWGRGKCCPMEGGRGVCCCTGEIQ